jgi:dolichyl-phosphate-mannose--protein O-mannosyl transferase
MLKRLFANPVTPRLLGAFTLWILSATLIFPHLDYPRAIVFDETYFIPTTQKYLHGIFFLEPHPPLAKLLIALGQKWYSPHQPANEFLTVEKIDRDWSADTDITGYRVMSAMFGTLVAPTVFLVLGILLGRALPAFALALPVAFDNALIVQSRAGLQDSFLLFFCFAAVLNFAIVNRKLDWSFRALGVLSALWGILSASAGGVKLTGLFVVGLAGFYGLRLLWARQIRRAIVFGLVFGAMLAATYLSYWAIHFSIARQIIGTQDYGITEEHRQILNGEKTVDPFTRFVIQMQDAVAYQHRYEAGVPRLDLSKPDEIGSPWYVWPLGGRAINYRWETPDGQGYRYIYLMGNPVTWLVSLLGVVFATALVLVDWLLRILPAERRHWLYAFVLLYWAYMIPMMFIERVMYLYHYFPPLVTGVILFALAGRQAQTISLNVKRIALVGLVVLVIIAFWHYKPLTYYELITGPEFRQRILFPVWDLRCVGC